MANELQVIEQREVHFYEDLLTAVRAEDGRVYVSLTQMCNALGIDRATQRSRITGHEVLNSGLMQIPVQTPGGTQLVYMLRINLVPLWLSGIRVRAVSEEVKEKLARFQTEAAEVLYEAFSEGRLTDSGAADLAASFTGSPEYQAYKMAQAVLEIARNQLMFRDEVVGRLDTLEGRLETVEAAMGRGDRYVTEDQASQISQAVKAVAMAFGKKSGRNEFGAVYGEMYRKFGISGYKMLPARRFEEAMRWLAEWHSEVTGEAGKAPF